MRKLIFTLPSRLDSALRVPQSYMQYLAKINKEIEAWAVIGQNQVNC